MREIFNAFYSEFQLTLKAPDVEERLDIYFFRPLGFAILKFLKVFSLTPNHYSFLALISGLVSGYYYSLGTQKSFLIGAVFFLLFGVLDCCDGMLARLEKKATRFGRILDGIVDLLANFSVYLGFYFGIKKAGFPYPINSFSLIFLAGAGKWLQNNFYDNYLMQYLVFKNKGQNSYSENEITSIRNQLKNTPSIFKKFFLNLYLFFTKIQNGLTKVPLNVSPEKYCELNKLPMLLWGVMGASAHIVAMVIASLLFYPQFFYFYTIIFCNIWMLFLFFYQRNILKKMALSI